ncbi:MAG: hypothetical protein U5J83_15000 [Bryobacterales bacterium]|nr:hypothetical protein [Bryobacterales bacterium]
MADFGYTDQDRTLKELLETKLCADYYTHGYSPFRTASCWRCNGEPGDAVMDATRRPVRCRPRRRQLPL